MCGPQPAVFVPSNSIDSSSRKTLKRAKGSLEYQQTLIVLRSSPALALQLRYYSHWHRFVQLRHLHQAAFILSRPGLWRLTKCWSFLWWSCWTMTYEQIWSIIIQGREPPFIHEYAKSYVIHNSLTFPPSFSFWILLETRSRDPAMWQRCSDAGDEIGRDVWRRVDKERHRMWVTVFE